MSDYNPIPEVVQEAYNAFKAAAEDSGLRITHMLLHSNCNTLKEGEDIEMFDSNKGNIVVRYWPAIVVPAGELSVACMVSEGEE